MKAIFLSSDYVEFADERKALQNLIESNALMRESFSLVNPEVDRRADPPVEEALRAIDQCDIFVALLGRRYGPPTRNGTSAIDLQFQRARELGKICLIFVKGVADEEREPRMQLFLRNVGSQLLFRRYKTVPELRRELLDALSLHASEALLRRTTPKRRRSVRVFFGTAPGRADEPTVIFTPSRDSWDNFGIRTHFDYEITGFEGVGTHSGRLHLGFVASDQRWRSPGDEIVRLLRESVLDGIPASDVPPFFTMQENLQDYRNLVGRLGPDTAEDLLLALNDVVAQRHSKNPQWLGQALSTEAFTMAFLRHSESFFAFHNAASVLAGLNAESLRGISTDFHLTFKLPTFENAHEIRFSFEHSSELPRRIAVVIGKNGVGKSQTLSHFADGLISGDTKLLQTFSGDRPSVNRLLAISSPGETYTTFPGVPRRHSRIDYRRVYLSRRQYGGRESAFGETVIQLARSEESIRGRSRWQLFCAIVSDLMPLGNVFLETRNGRSLGGSGERRNEIPVPLAEMQEGREQAKLERWSSIDPLSDGCRYIGGRILPLSSGQITFLRFAAQVSLNIEKGTMLLFDEPETHLHPNLVADFVRLLDRLLVETGSFAILATHSAYFVREVPRSQVLILRASGEGFSETVPARLKTLGADVGAISSFVFEEEPYGFMVTDLGKQLAAAGDKAESQLQQLEAELPAEVIMYLRRLIGSGSGQ